MTNSDGKKNVVLITEDEPAMMRALAEKIERSGFTVLTARDGVEGLELAKREHPDAIILDILMPKMDGISMMGSLRADDWGKKVPIIVLTNLDANDKMIGTILKDQPAYYLLKADTELEGLVEKLKEVLYMRR